MTSDSLPRPPDTPTEVPRHDRPASDDTTPNRPPSETAAEVPRRDRPASDDTTPIPPSPATPAGRAEHDDLAATAATATTATSVRLVVNGTYHDLTFGARETLLAVLRDRLGLSGTKFGCGIGYCGACTVLVDGAAAHSCCLLAATLESRVITTIEGIADGNAKDEGVQAAFLEAGAVQCGYCTPGFVLSVHALLAENPTPSEADVRAFLTGNICRCTGFAAIVRAALAARNNG